MSEPGISAFLITLNEAAHIEEVLTSLQRFEEIILVDSGSTDGTPEIAAKMGAKVFHQDWLGFAKQKAYAMSLCQHDWVLNVDGDEVLSDAFVTDIKTKVSQADAKTAFRVAFDDLFWGRAMSTYSKKRTIVRLYHRDWIRFPEDRFVHENVVLQPGTREQRMPGLIKHYGYDTTEGLMHKQNTYSSLKAQEKFQRGKSPSLFNLLFSFPFTFIKSYFFRNMWCSGKRGFVTAMIDAQYSFLKHAKLYELTYRAREEQNKKS